jgi:purine catabolism regulator
MAPLRWVHSTELLDPTPWLRGGELLLTTGVQVEGAKAQRELIERLADHRIAGLGFGTGFGYKRLPAALVMAARKRAFPLFEVPYELPFIAITERVFAELVNERYEMLQRNMAGDVLAEVLTGHLYPDEVQARLRPFGIGEQIAVIAFALEDPTAAAAQLERILERERARGLVALRGGLLCGVIDPGGGDPVELARTVRSELAARFGDVRAGASRSAAPHALRASFHEARCALEAARLANGRAPEVATYEDLGAFQLLLSLQDDDALLTFCRGVLGPIEEAEGDYGDELVRSLDTFIEHNGHWERASAALFCHRHTLRYRMRRVEELTGRDLQRARDRIEFWLALRGRELTR